MSTAVKPARRRTGAGKTQSLLKERAYEQLKLLIQDSTFRPGDFLSERQLAARFGMSKTPLKAALERLTMEGFIAVSPQQGIVVRDLSIHEVADQFELRAALEAFVARSIAGKLSEPQKMRLRDNLRQQQHAAAERDVRTSVDLDTEFHGMLCEFQGNQEILRVMSQLREKMHRVIFHVFSKDAGRLAGSVDEHMAIAEAVLSGDADLAARQVERHLEFGKQFLLAPRRG